MKRSPWVVGSDIGPLSPDTQSDGKPRQDFRGSFPTRLADGRPEPGPGVGPEAVGRAGGDPEGGGRVRDAHPGEVAELDQLGRLGVGRGQPAQGLVDREQLGVAPVVGGDQGVLGEVDRATAPPRLRAFRRRARSTRMCRMASAAAAKKWPRPAHRGPSAGPTSRRYASWTRAVAPGACGRRPARPSGRRPPAAARRRRAAAGRRQFSGRTRSFRSQRWDARPSFRSCSWRGEQARRGWGRP